MGSCKGYNCYPPLFIQEHFYDPVSHSGFIEMRLRNLRRKLHDDQRKRSRYSDSSGVSITLKVPAEGEEESSREWTTVIKRMKPVLSTRDSDSVLDSVSRPYFNGLGLVMDSCAF